MPWLKRHDVTIQLRENRVLFSSEFCKPNCLRKYTRYTQKNPKAQSTSSNTQVPMSRTPVPSKKKPLDI